VLPLPVFTCNFQQAFVHDNNLYYQASPEVDPVQVTTSGVADSIFNGIPDWNYEGISSSVLSFSYI
jgi:hypothetical protein